MYSNVSQLRCHKQVYCYRSTGLIVLRKQLATLYALEGMAENADYVPNIDPCWTFRMVDGLTMRRFERQKALLSNGNNPPS